MKRILALFIGLALIAGTALIIPAFAGDRQAAQTAYQKADAFAKQGNYRAARIEMLNALKADPDWHQARIELAQIYLKLFDPAAAEGELRRAIDQGVAADDIRYLMADTLHKMGDDVRARKWLVEGVIAPEYAGDAARILAEIELAAGEMEAARTAYDRAIQLTPENSALWTSIARFRFANGDQAGAVDAVDYAVELDPGSVRALHFRGELMRSQYGLASALPWFERALAIDPFDVATLEEYGATLGDMGRMKEMLDVARRIISLQPQNPRAFFMQAVLAARSGDYALAQSILNRTSGALDEVPAMMQIAGVVEFQQGNYVRAIARFERLLSIQPHNLRTQQLLARALYAEGDHISLLEQFRSVADRAGAPIYLLTLVGRSLEATGEGDAALAYLERARSPDEAMLMMLYEPQDMALLAQAASRDPKNAGVVIPYARGLIGQSAYFQAQVEAKKLADGNPGAPDAHILLGDTYLLNNNPQAALTSYENAARIRYSQPVLRRMIMALQLVGRRDDAQRVLLRFMGYNPANIPASRMLANVYIEYRNWPAALVVLDSLKQRIGTGNPYVMSDLALSQLRLGQAAAAQQSAQLAYAFQPSSALTTHVFGMAKAAGDTDKMVAVELLEKAQKLQSNNPWLDYHLAQAYLAVAAKDKAMSALRGSLAKGPFPERDAAALLFKQLQQKS